MPTTVDDTIDEDNDMTMLQNSTLHNNTTIDQQESIDETRIADDDDNDDDDEDTPSKGLVLGARLVVGLALNFFGGGGSLSVSESIMTISAILWVNTR